MAVNNELTEAEIWDDSALQRSWNDALDEYKKYHSLAAKGEKIAVEAIADDPPTETSAVAESAVGGATDLDRSHRTAPTDAAADQLPNPAPAHEAPSSGTDSALPPMPQALLGKGRRRSGSPTSSDDMLTVPLTVENEDMKNLMMSWYYAGYYTGLFEGKQLAFASMANDAKPPRL